MTFKHSTVLSVTASSLASAALADVKISFIRSLSSDTGLSTLRGAEIAIEKINAAGGMGDEKLMFVSADADKDAAEGVRAYEYLAETEEVNFIISGSTDDVSLGWLPCMQEFQIPTLNIWTSCIGIIDTVIGDPRTVAPYFVNIASNEALATLHINFGADVLKKEMSQDSVVILAEDAASDEAVIGLVTEALDPIAGIEAKEIITYDVGTVDFAPLLSKTRASGADLVYQVSLVNSQVISSQHVKLQVPMATTGVNASTLGLKYWRDTGDAGDGISTLSPIPSVGLELDPESQRFVDTYQAKYDSRPKIPHFSGFNAYWSLKQAVAAAEAAGGFGGAEAWSAEMEKQDITLKKGDKVWSCYAFWDNGGVEEVTGRTYPHNARFDLTVPYDDIQPSTVVIQWKEDGEVDVAYPPECTTTKFIVPDWVK